MKVHDQNRNGYDWRSFMDSWKTYISKEEVEDVESAIGLTRRVDMVDRVDTMGSTQQVYF